MGFFDKLKENMNSGGVDVSVSVDTFGLDVNATIVLTSTEERFVKTLRANFVKKTYVKVENSEDAERQEEVLESSDIASGLTLMPNQPLTFEIEFSKPMDIDANAHYIIKTKANVDGIILDPSRDVEVRF